MRTAHWSASDSPLPNRGSVRMAKRAASPSVPAQLESPPEQLRAGARADADAEVGRRLETAYGLQDEEAEVTGLVAALGIGATQLAVGGLREQQAGAVEDGLLIVKPVRVDIALVEGPQELVELAPLTAAMEFSGST